MRKKHYTIIIVCLLLALVLLGIVIAELLVTKTIICTCGIKAVGNLAILDTNNNPLSSYSFPLFNPSNSSDRHRKLTFKINNTGNTEITVQWFLIGNVTFTWESSNVWYRYTFSVDSNMVIYLQLNGTNLNRNTNIITLVPLAIATLVLNIDFYIKSGSTNKYGILYNVTINGYGILE